jgi:hypothetical protein
MEDVKKALDCGALRRCERSEIIAASPMFSVLQQEKSRLIFDVRQVNAGVDYFQFSLEGVTSIPVLAAGCSFMSKLDLSSAYWQVPVDADLSARLGTWVPGALFAQWVVLPFGLSVAPFAFASITQLLVRAWRAVGIRCLAYLDDIIFFAASLEEHVWALRIVVQDLVRAGLRVSVKKAFILPFRRLDALGVSVDLPRQAFFVSPSYVEKVTTGVRDILAASPLLPRKALEILFGRLGFVGLVHPYLNIRRSIIASALSVSPGGPVPAVVEIWPELAEELRWWLSAEALGFLSSPSWWDALPYTRLYARTMDSDGGVTVALASDASDFGVGLLLPGELVPEPLPPSLIGAPSAARELYGMLRALQRADSTGLLSEARSPFLPPRCIRLVCDAQAAVGAMGGATVAPSCWRLAWDIVLLLRKADIRVSFEWAPRDSLVLADQVSRLSSHDLSRSLLPMDLVMDLWRLAWGADSVPEVEMFADPGARITEARWCARFDPPGSAGDGLDSVWWQSRRRLWVFPPFALRRQVVRRLVTFNPNAIAVLPDDDEAVRIGLARWRRRPLGHVRLRLPPDFQIWGTASRPLAAFLPPSGLCDVSVGELG